MGELNAKSLLACVLLITSGTYLNKVAAQKQKQTTRNVDKDSNFSYAGFLKFFLFFFGDLNISACLTKELIWPLWNRRTGITI